MKMQNLPNLKIAIVGEIGVGKTTLLNKLLSRFEEKPFGFKTQPIIEENTLKGFEIVDLDSLKKAKIGEFDKNFIIKPVTDGFETVGVEALRSALSKGNIIVMDELGFLESEAKNFKEMVFKVLESDKLVFYVVKAEQNEFLKATLTYASRVFYVNKENRDKLEKTIWGFIWDYTKI